MRKPKSREIIERILWDRRVRAEDYLLAYIHRGVEGGRKTLPLSRVLNVKGNWLTILNGEVENRIPLHRVIEIINVKTGKKIWVTKKVFK